MSRESFYVHYSHGCLVSLQNNIFLSTLTHPSIHLIRQWKNNNKGAFFSKLHITCEAQEIWFHNYLNRVNEYMFLVHEPGGDLVGCMGCRMTNVESFEIFNVIRGVDKYRGSGFMALGIELILKFCLLNNAKFVWLSVLNDNPAYSWYQRRGFTTLESDCKSSKLHYNNLSSQFVPDDFGIRISRRT